VHDTLDRSTTTEQHVRRTPRLITKALCTLATVKSAHVLALLLTGSGVGLNRWELAHVFCTVLVSIPALYLLAEDMLAAPSSREAVKVFRLGIRIGRMHRR
jgi:hypothetical protein